MDNNPIALNDPTGAIAEGADAGCIEGGGPPGLSDLTGGLPGSSSGGVAGSSSDAMGALGGASAIGNICYNINSGIDNNEFINNAGPDADKYEFKNISSNDKKDISEKWKLYFSKEYPKHTDSFKGFWGGIKYFITGGIENGARYNWNGNYLGPAPIMGMPPSFIGGPLRKGQSAIKIGKFLFNPNYLHQVLKPQVLKMAGDYIKIVGANPDIQVKGLQIILVGTKNGPFAGKTFETGLNILDFIF